MLNLLFEKYPKEIIVDNESYPIYTDFRDWIAFFDMRDDTSIDKEDIILCAFSWFKDTVPNDKTLAFQSLLDFASCKNLNPNFEKKSKIEVANQKQILSYLYDCEYILGAFLQVYHIDLNTIDYMHWYKFNALLNALPDDTPLKQRMIYRNTNLGDIKDKSEKKRIKKIKQQIAIPTKPLDAFQVGNIF
ncbi:MAG: bacteriophage Gp15 family protein [Ruminococcus sp.]|nr:bacteriophage Gp15 family protein [Ruminococcus sp.]